MRKILMALALVLAPMSLAGCATIATLTGQEQVSTFDEKALLTAEYAFESASTAILAADTVGALTPELATAIQPKYLQAYNALRTARALYDANRAAEAEGATRGAILATAVLLQALVDAGILEQ